MPPDIAAGTDAQPTTEPQGGTPPATPENGGDAVDVKALQAELADLKAHVKTLNNESASRRRKLDEYEKAEEERKQAQMTELEKERDKAAKAARERDEALQLANDRLIRGAVYAEAAKHGVVHPEDAYALIELKGVSVNDDATVEGVAEAVKALVEAGRLPLSGRPGAPSLDGGAGGNQQTQRAALTAAEEAQAKRMGIKPEDYLKHKKPGTFTKPVGADQSDDRRI